MNEPTKLTGTVRPPSFLILPYLLAAVIAYAAKKGWKFTRAMNAVIEAGLKALGEL